MNINLIVSAALVIFSLKAGQAQIIINFESDSAGSVYTKERWKTHGFLDLSWTQGSERTSVDEEFAHSGSKSLKVAYPKGGVGPGETGHQAPCGLEPADEYYISYWLRFSKDFSWGTENEGGKLPGLSGGAKCSGGQFCDGTNGFTVRYMWRMNGQAVLYLYHMNKSGKYGDDVELKFPDGKPAYFIPGEWINLMERVKINSPGERNGEVQIWFNGKEVLSVGELEFVSDTTKVDALYFSSFHGGADSTWSPQNNSYIWFDDFIATNNPDDLGLTIDKN